MWKVWGVGAVLGGLERGWLLDARPNNSRFRASGVWPSKSLRQDFRRKAPNP